MKCNECGDTGFRETGRLVKKYPQGTGQVVLCDRCECKEKEK
jgi:hypothetical protein